MEEYIFHWLKRGIDLSHSICQVQYQKPNEFIKKDVLNVIEAFSDCVAYLQGRREKVKTLVIDSESPVQDLLFVMLKPHLPDLTFEDPSPKSAASYAIKDLYVPSLRLVIEAKYIGTRSDVKPIEKQLADDIWKYSSNLDCEDLVFFIYDPFFCISDRRNFINKMTRHEGEFTNNGRQILIQTIIKP